MKKNLQHKTEGGKKTNPDLLDTDSVLWIDYSVYVFRVPKPKDYHPH